MARTTVKIPDELLKKAKTEAAQRDVPLHEVVSDALRQRYANIVQATGEFIVHDKDMGAMSSLRRKDIYDDLD